MGRVSNLVTPKRLVILGSRGFIGSHLAREAKALAWPVLELGANQVDLTVTQSVASLSEAIRSDDSVVFVSALTPDKGRDRATLIKNMAMADHVCQALERTKCAHLTYISSDAVYSDTDHLIRETSACDPSSFHGVMHLSRERMLQEMAKQSDIPLLILRPCAVYGSGDTHNSYGPNRFMRTALSDKEIKISGEGEEQRDHLLIEDLVNAICHLVSRGNKGILNIASGSSVSFAEVATQIARIVGSDVKITKLVRQSPITHRHFDITARIAALPKLSFTPLSDGLSKMFEIQQRPA